MTSITFFVVKFCLAIFSGEDKPDQHQIMNFNSFFNLEASQRLILNEAQVKMYGVVKDLCRNLHTTLSTNFTNMRASRALIYPKEGALRWSERHLNAVNRLASNKK